MNKIRTLVITNVLLFFSVAIQALTGLIFAFDLFETNTVLLKFLFRIHKYNGFVMAFLVVVHIVLNWGWIKSQILKIKTA